MARTLGQLDKKPVNLLERVKPAQAAALEEQFDIRTVFDLLTHYPRRYIDRTHQAHIRELKLGEEAMVLARVERIASRRTKGRPPKTLVTAVISDGTGRLQVQFFNQPWRVKQLPAGTEAIFFGKLDQYKGQKQLTNPVVDLIGDQTGRLIPVYPQSDKARVYSRHIARWIEEALERAGAFA
ncbi:MAG TPA: OB-fold nucleic acid binding domain-containing protein, partial [Acidimicrobiales bacterium]|nr:OB-fold nucleic acid binding domain-containing protein [Acidimicrobiales bacterium]